jgi:predicted Zn-dependent peptidase
MPLDLRNSIPIFHKILPNGMRVVLAPTQKIPVASLHLSYKVG